MDTTDTPFDAALTAGNLSIAHDIASQMPPHPPEPRIEAYRKIMQKALSLGRWSYMMIVAPFCGHRLTLLEMKQCIAVALANADVESLVTGKMFIGEKLSHEEAAALWAAHARAGKKVASGVRFGVLSTDPFLLGLIKRLIPMHRLSCDDILALWVAELSLQ